MSSIDRGLCLVHKISQKENWLRKKTRFICLVIPKKQIRKIHFRFHSKLFPQIEKNPELFT